MNKSQRSLPAGEADSFRDFPPGHFPSLLLEIVLPQVQFHSLVSRTVMLEPFFPVLFFLLFLPILAGSHISLAGLELKIPPASAS